MLKGNAVSSATDINKVEGQIKENRIMGWISGFLGSFIPDLHTDSPVDHRDNERDENHYASSREPHKSSDKKRVPCPDCGGSGDTGIGEGYSRMCPGCNGMGEI